MLSYVLPIYAMVASGWFLRKAGWIKPEADSSLTKLAIDFCLPCFIVCNMLENKRLESVVFSMQTILLGICNLAGSLLVAYVVASLMRLRVGEGKRTFVTTSATGNYGFFTIALVSMLYAGTADGEELLGLVLTHNVGCDLVFWTLGIILLSGKPDFTYKMFLRGPVIAVFVGLALIWTGAGAYIPDSVRSFLKFTGFPAIPINLMMFGMMIADMFSVRDFSPKIVFSGVAVKMLLIPAILVFAAFVLPIDAMFKKLILFQAFTPCGVTSAVMARSFGGYPKMSVQITLLSCAASFLTLPVWFYIGFGLIGE